MYLHEEMWYKYTNRHVIITICLINTVLQSSYDTKNVQRRMFIYLLKYVVIYSTIVMCVTVAPMGGIVLNKLGNCCVC